MTNQPVSVAPIVFELPASCAAVDVFRSLADRPHLLFLDSALRHPELGRVSYVAADPVQVLTLPADGREVLATVEQQVAEYPLEHQPELPTFQGGAAGLLAYDLGRSLERIPTPRCDDFHLPAITLGIYDVVIAFDHRQNRSWIISQGWPAVAEADRRARAAERLAQFRRWIDRRPDAVTPLASHRQPRTLNRSSPHFPTDHSKTLYSNFTRDGYLQAVQRSIDYIYAGDIFQVNLAQRLLTQATSSAVDLYLRMRARNPATFAGFFDAGPFQIVSASPERFLKVDRGLVESRPIKGTRPRAGGAEADLFMGDDLRGSEKDRAENVMIVDLIRNDLSRVCEPSSVRVTELCKVESYAFVQHLVSAVAGRLADSCSPVDLIRASFPGGSITGAPKVRAMEIIAELEPHARGAYCGSLGFFDSVGNLDLSILIRTVTAAQGWWQFPVGGGIVSQSEPATEYAETWHKAEGMLRALWP